MTEFGEWAREHGPARRKEPPRRRGRPVKWDVPGLAGSAYDLLASAQETCEHDVRGLTAAEMSGLLQVPPAVVPGIIRYPRLLFGGDREVGVPVHYCGRKHVYHLAGQVEAGHKWQLARIRGQIAQAEVSKAWWQSMARAYDSDRANRMYAEAMVISFERQAEDLERIAGNLMLAA